MDAHGQEICPSYELRPLEERERMIDPDVLSVVEKRVAQDLEDRRGMFEREVAQIKERMAARNAFYSSATVRCILDAIGNEFRVRVSLIWHAFARALDAKGILLTDNLSSEVKERLGGMLDKESHDLPKDHQELAGITRGPVPGKSLAQLKAAALDRIFTEIEYAVLKQSARTETDSRVVNIYQSYGIVQSGAGSSASLTVKLASEELREIQKAIESVKQVIQESSSLRSDERDQALELVSDVEKETNRDQPNRFRICGALQGLATTVRTIAAAPQAYEVLKGAAALLGLQLP